MLSVQGCEDQYVHIRCPFSTYINVIDAQFGRTQSSTIVCPYLHLPQYQTKYLAAGQEDLNCSAKNSLEVSTCSWVQNGKTRESAWENPRPFSCMIRWGWDLWETDTILYTVHDHTIVIICCRWLRAFVRRGGCAVSRLLLVSSTQIRALKQANICKSNTNAYQVSLYVCIHEINIPSFYNIKQVEDNSS